MKRILIVLLAAVLLVTTCIAGPGDGNIDGGGGGTGDGSGGSGWDGGNDGVRVSVMKGTSTEAILDLSNRDWSDWVERCYVKRNKLAYQRGAQLYPTSPYTSWKPPVTMPRIISSTGGNNIAAIKSYFTDDEVIQYIALNTGIDYGDLIGGEYKLLLEPISYFKYKGVRYAMTATECALYDAMVSNDLALRMGLLTHQNQPFAMFLERPDLGIDPWTGATSGKQSDANIINYLGVGIISFREQPIPPEEEPTNFEFRTDTDVIVSFSFRNTGAEITPDDEAYLDIDIGGTTYRRQFVCPAGETQLAWVKWHTPDTVQQVPITVTCEEIPRLDRSFRADIVQLPEVEPPDPVYEDRNDGFRYEEPPDYGKNTSTTWGEWYSFWVHDPTEHEDSEWVDEDCDSTCPPGCTEDHGYSDSWTWTCDESSCDCPDDHGHWEWEYTIYEARLAVDLILEPGRRVPTAYKKSGAWIMASGYGVEVKCLVSVTEGVGVDKYDITPVQNIVTLWSEFGYQTYDRLMTTAESRTSRYRLVDWTLKPNRFSYYSDPVHFTPLWYPDDTKFTVDAVVLDAWTPGGMLYTTVDSSVDIFKSVLDDWYIRVIE